MTLQEAQEIKDKLLYKRMERLFYFNNFIKPILFYLPFVLLAIVTRLRNPVSIVLFVLTSFAFIIVYIINSASLFNIPYYKSNEIDTLIEKHKKKMENKRLKELERVADTVIFQHESKTKIEVLKQEIERLKSIGGADV